jgi:hypothetical protein
VPTIIAGPSALTVNEGQSATFTVSASGAGALNYQWRRGSTDIPGATTPTYGIAAAAASDDNASFTVVVSDAAGSVASAPASLTVRYLPRFTSQPAAVLVATGGRATFSAVAAGNPPPSLQWRRNGVNVAGATETSFSIPATSLTDSGAVYSVVASNALGSATSNGALLEVLDTPAIVRNPASVTVVAPAAATFTVLASGSPVLTYVWTYNGVDLANTNSPTVIFSPTAVSENGAILTVKVSNRVGTATTLPFTLNVH